MQEVEDETAIVELNRSLEAMRLREDGVIVEERWQNNDIFCFRRRTPTGRRTARVRRSTIVKESKIRV